MQRQYYAISENVRVIAVLSCFVACWPLPLPGQHAAAKLELRVTESPLGKIPFNATGQKTWVSPDGQHIAFVSKVSTLGVTGQLFIDNVKQEYPIIINDNFGSPVFGGDGQHVAYFSSSRGPLPVFVVVGGVAGTHYRDIVSAPTFGGSDRKRLAYGADRNKRQFVVNDGTEGQEYDRITGVTFSPDGQKLAYGAARNGKWIMVGSAPPGSETEYDALGFPEFSVDGRLAFQANVGDRQIVALAGNEGPKYGWATTPRFSPDGRHMAYLASSDGAAEALGKKSIIFGYFHRLTCGEKCVAVVDGVERTLNGPPDERFWINNDGILAYSYAKTIVKVEGGVVKSKDKVRAVVVGGKEITEAKSRIDFNPIGPIIFSPNGKRFAFRLTGPKGDVVIVDGTEQRTYRDASIPVFSPDSDHVVYSAVLNTGTGVLVVDGVELLGGQKSLSVVGPAWEMREAGLWPDWGLSWRFEFPVRFSSSSVMEAFRFQGRDLSRIRMELVAAGTDGH